MRWEYLVEDVKCRGLRPGRVSTDEVRELLDRAGAQGWECFFVFGSGGVGTAEKYTLLFKRHGQVKTEGL